MLRHSVCHTHPFNSPFFQKGKTNQHFTEARDSEWQWHQLGHMQVCTSLLTHASTPPLSFLPAVCPSCHPANIVKAITQAVLFVFQPCGWIK